jgi:hypothetical protein
MFRHYPHFNGTVVALRLPVCGSMMVSTSASLRRAAAWVILVAAVAASGCDDPLKDVTPTPNLRPTFVGLKQGIFSTTETAGRTACVTCHTSQGRIPQQGPNPSSGAGNALVTVPSRERLGAVRAISGEPAPTLLIRKPEGGETSRAPRLQHGLRYLTSGHTLYPALD